jgi:hypothetical protein
MMKVLGSYHDQGYAHLEGLVPAEVAQAFLQGLKQDMGPGAIAKTGRRPRARREARRRCRAQKMGRGNSPARFSGSVRD